MRKTLKDAVFEFGYEFTSDKLFTMLLSGEVECNDYLEIARKLAEIRVEYEPMTCLIVLLRSQNFIK